MGLTRKCVGADLRPARPRLQCPRHEVVTVGAPVVAHPAALAPVPAGYDQHTVLGQAGPGILSPVVHEAEHALELVAVARLVVVAEDLGERVPAHRSEDDMSAAGPRDLHGVVAVAGERRDHALGHVGVLAAAGAAAHGPHPRRLARLRHLPFRQPSAVIHGDLV